MKWGGVRQPLVTACGGAETRDWAIGDPLSCAPTLDLDLMYATACRCAYGRVGEGFGLGEGIVGGDG